MNAFINILDIKLAIDTLSELRTGRGREVNSLIWQDALGTFQGLHITSPFRHRL